MTRLDPRNWMEILPAAECWELLETCSLGRVAYDDGVGPVILPFNYAVHGRAVRLRTSPHSAVGLRSNDRRVAFEVDQVDLLDRSGWSVLLRGHAQLADIEMHPTGEEPVAWPEGNRPLIVEIEPTEVSGRRLTGR